MNAPFNIRAQTGPHTVARLNCWRERQQIFGVRPSLPCSPAPAPLSLHRLRAFAQRTSEATAQSVAAALRGGSR